MSKLITLIALCAVLGAKFTLQIAAEDGGLSFSEEKLKSKQENK